MTVGELVNKLDVEAAQSPRDRHVFDYEVIVGWSSWESYVSEITVDHEKREVRLT